MERLEEVDEQILLSVTRQVAVQTSLQITLWVIPVE